MESLLIWGIPSELEIEKVVFVPRGYSKLPSVDPLSNHIMFMIMINEEHKFTIKRPTWRLYTEFPRILANNYNRPNPVFVQRQIHNMEVSMDLSFNKKEKSKIWAYKSLVQNSLERAVFLTYWGIDENIDVAILRYTKGIVPLVKSLYARYLRRQMKKTVKDICGDKDPADIIDEIYKESATRLEDFLKLLGNKKYVMGDFPCSLDVFICSMVAPVLYMDLPEKRFHGIITAVGNGDLKQYVDNFLAQNGNITEAPEDWLESDRAPLMVIMGAGICATLAMVGFAYFHGICK